MALNETSSINDWLKTKPADDASWTQPETDYKAKYPDDNIMQSKSGHFIEMDDTQGHERLRIEHRIGTFTEVHPDGTRVNKIIGDNFEIVEKNNFVQIKGICNVTIEGDSVVHIKGDKYEKIDGDFVQEVAGNYTQTVAMNSGKKAYILSNGDMTLGVGDPLTGTFEIINGSTMMIDGDLNVSGALRANMVTSETKVNAGTQVNAGPLGFVTELGGLAVGVPVAVPMNIVCSQSYYGGVSVNAPFINGVMVRDIAGTMMGIRFQHNAHTHIGNKGFPTSPPIVPMTLL